MKIKILLIILFLPFFKSNLFSQKRVKLELKPSSTNVSNFSTFDSLIRTINESNETIFRYSLNRKSSEMLTDTGGLSTNSFKNNFSVKVLKKSKKIFLIPDLNFDNVYDDTAIACLGNTSFPIELKIFFLENDVVKKLPLKIYLSPKYSDDSQDIIGLEVSHSNSSTGSFRFENNLFKLEFRLSRIYNKFTKGNVNVNISEKNQDLKKIDFNKVISYSLKSDTIISNNLGVIIDSLSTNGSYAYLKIFRRINSKSGYKKDYIMYNMNLPSLIDTNKIAKTLDVCKKSVYTLFDFWGSWCIPCIENFDTLSKLSLKYDKSFMQIVGIDCEYSNNFNPAKQVLKQKNIEWENYGFNYITDGSITKKLFVKSFPTYFLVNNNGKIIFRENSEGLIKIIQFLKKQYKKN